MAKERNNLPEDAVKINGKYIEDYVTGYKTIKAVGREVISRDLTATETMNDGAILRNVRYTPREITIEFAVARSSVADMRASMDTLKSFLDVKEAQFIFNGDYSYYFVGTPVLDTDFDDVPWQALYFLSKHRGQWTCFQKTRQWHWRFRRCADCAG